MRISKEDKEKLSALTDPIYDVYGKIGYDLPEDADTEEIIECCIDADRLLLTGENEEANNLVHEMVRKYDYMSVLKYLCKVVRL